MKTTTLDTNTCSIETQRTFNNIFLLGFLKVKTLFKRKSGIERALNDVRKGRVYTYNSIDDLLKEINN